MPSSDFFLSDDDARLLRNMQQRIENLERQTAERFAPGMFQPYAAPARSSFWSDSHLEAIGELWTHSYPLNDLNTDGVVKDRNESSPLAGSLAAELSADNPQQGQIGGLQSEGSYSYYFPGKSKSRVALPLLSSRAKEFHCEIIFKAQSLPQKAILFYNGVFNTNGFGLGIESIFGTAGENLYFHYGSSKVNTSITISAETWYDVQVFATATQLKVVVAGLNPVTKVVTASTFSVAILAITAGATSAFIGSGDATSGYDFKGWIDEFSIYDGNIGETEVVNSYHDRYKTALDVLPPPGFVLADGTAVGRAKYDRLFKVVGTIYGSGDGSTTFNLPNMKNRVPLGRQSEALGAVLSRQFGASEPSLSLLNVNWLVKV